MPQTPLSAELSAWSRKVMIALDVPDYAQAERLLDQLRGYPCYMKVGMQLFYAEGPKVVERLKEQGYNVFLDLKLHDIPNTVKQAAASMTRIGADMFNVHAAGGRRMMEAAREGIELAGTAHSRPHLIAVTQLTSTDRRMLNEEIGIQGEVEDSVLHYARLAHASGLDGVVASPREVSRIKQAVGRSFITVTPGIRPAGSDRNDQMRTMTPGEAVSTGTDFVVIGRAVTAASDPAQALHQILKEMDAYERK